MGRPTANHRSFLPHPPSLRSWRVAVGFCRDVLSTLLQDLLPYTPICTFLLCPLSPTPRLPSAVSYARQPCGGAADSWAKVAVPCITATPSGPPGPGPSVCPGQASSSAWRQPARPAGG